MMFAVSSSGPRPQLASGPGRVNIRQPRRRASLCAAWPKRRDTIRSLFAGLTSRPKRGQPLFDSAVAEARRKHWFIEGAVPDTLEGRFAMLATIVALFVVRLEEGGERASEASVSLTERFIESMDSEVRELGVGDPAIGRKVRSMVGALAGRVERWRALLADPQGDWGPTVVRSVYRDVPPAPPALAHSVDRLQALWSDLSAADEAAIAEGRAP